MGLEGAWTLLEGHLLPKHKAWVTDSSSLQAFVDSGALEEQGSVSRPSHVDTKGDSSGPCHPDLVQDSIRSGGREPEVNGTAGRSGAPAGSQP